MANITEKNGKFHVRVYRKGGSAVCKSFTVRKDAAAWGKQTEADIQAGRWKPAEVVPSLTLRAALARYRLEITPTKKSAVPETSLIRSINKAKLVAKELGNIRGADIAALRDQWKAEGLAAASVVRRLAIISHLFEVACKEWGHEVPNPVKLVSKPNICNARVRRMTTAELDAVLAASGSAELSNVARLAVASAMRLSEIVGLQWADVNLLGRTLTLHDTKNGRPRVVPLSPAALDLLGKLPRRIDGAVFGIAGPSVSKAWRRAVKRARVAYVADCTARGEAVDAGWLIDLHFHDARHEATSRLFEAGVFNTMEVASITGHKTLGMLARYSHMQASRLADKLATAM